MIELNTHTTDTFTTTDGLIIRYQDIFDGIAAFVQVFATKNGKGMSDEDLEDLYQTACLKAVKYHESYNPKYASPKTYGSRIAENCAKDALRAFIRQSGTFTSMEMEGEDGEIYEPESVMGYRGDEFEADAELLSNEAESHIEGSMDSLNVNYRYILELRRKGLTPKEMAEEIGCTPGAVSTLLCRAKKALAKELGTHFLREYGMCA